MKVKTFNLSLPIELVKYIDLQAKLGYESRSSYIKQAVISRLKKEGVFKEAAIQDPAETYRLLRRQRLKKFLAEYKLEDEDLTS